MERRQEEARLRRQGWVFGKASRAEAKAMDLAFWQKAGASAKLTAIRALADEAEIIKGHAPPPGLQRSVGGLRRSQG